MGQITGALIGIAMVLAAVFIPMAFFGGSTGVIYRQFSITIVSSMVLSVIVAIVFTPALCATLLKPIPKGHHGTKRGFFGWFNRAFDRSSHGYANTVAVSYTHLVTRMPCCCTSCGSSGCASDSLFCTCTWAVSGLVPWRNVSVMDMLPSELLSEEMYSRPSRPFICCSITRCV